MAAYVKNAKREAVIPTQCNEIRNAHLPWGSLPQMTMPCLLCHCKSITNPHLPTHYSKSGVCKPRALLSSPRLQHWLTRERFHHNVIKTELHQNPKTKLLVLFIRLWILIWQQWNQQIRDLCFSDVCDLKGTERWTRCWRLMNSSPFGPVKTISILFLGSNRKRIRETLTSTITNTII